MTAVVTDSERGDCWIGAQADGPVLTSGSVKNDSDEPSSKSGDDHQAERVNCLHADAAHDQNDAAHCANTSDLKNATSCANTNDINDSNRCVNTSDLNNANRCANTSDNDATRCAINSTLNDENRANTGDPNNTTLQCANTSDPKDASLNDATLCTNTHDPNDFTHHHMNINPIGTSDDGDNDSTASCQSCMCSCCCGMCSKETENKRLVFQWYDVPLALAAAGLYVADVYTDLRLALQFALDGHVRYGAVTLFFVALAYVVSVGYGVKEYVRLRRQRKDTYAAPASVWFVRLLFTVLMLGPVVNTVEYIYNGCKSRRKRCKDRAKYVRRMKNHHMNNAFLRLFEACLEAAPQLVFQLYVLVVSKPEIEGVEGVWRVLTVVTSWLSLAHTLTAFTKSRRNSSDDDCLCHPRATIRHQAFDFLWRLAETGGRVLCIALFTSVFQFWLLAVLIPHGLIMALWQYLQERDWSFISILEYFVYAYVFQFCFINNYSGGYSRIQFLAFYLLFYAESFAMLGLWYWFTPDQGQWFHLWGLVAGLASLPLHVLLQLFYYKCCHPNSRNIKALVLGDRDTWKQHLIGPFTPRRSA